MDGIDRLLDKAQGFVRLAEIPEAMRGLSSKLPRIKVTDPVGILARIALIKCLFCSIDGVTL
jgi:hypothetical protein